MTVRLTIRTAEWRAGVARVASRVDGLVPVVKGNGYGFGRPALSELASELSDTIAVGNVHELDTIRVSSDVVVLTPTRTAPDTTAPILTVGRTEHVDSLRTWGGRVLVKVESSMHRYGTAKPAELVEAARAAGLTVVGISLHLPLDGGSGAHHDEVVRTLPLVDPEHEVWLSHLRPDDYARLPSTHRYRLRLGTSLWLGSRNTLQLHADVIDVRPITQGEPAGYRLEPAADDGHLVMIAAGTANGVTPLPDGRSPFHHDRQRMPLHEAPHMHTSMCLVARGATVPAIGDWVDVQRPLTMTAVDQYDWR